MAAYAEGLNIIANADVGKRQHEMDAETAPLEHPELYQYEIDTTEVAEVWRRGSVVGSWLLDLTAQALIESPDARGVRRARLGLGRGSLDVDRRDRGGRAGAGPDDRALLALLVARARRLREPAAVRDAQAVRRARREDRRDGRSPSRSFRTREAAAERGAEIVAGAAAQAVAERGRFTFAVSGGRTPWRDVRRARTDGCRGRRSTIFQVDERVAPDGDPDRNLTHAPAEPAARRRRRRPADAGHRARPRGGRRRATRPRSRAARPRPPRSRPRRPHRLARFPATRCSTSPIATSPSRASTRVDGG